MTTPRTAIYPGTFDPITFGHLDLIQRGAKLADRLIIGVASDTDKSCMFSLEDRAEMIKGELLSLPQGVQERIEVRAFSGLLVNFMHEVDACIILRGLRAVSDFEYEFQMACMNTRLDDEVETIFLPASETMQFVSSRFIKQICRLGGDISAMASRQVTARLQEYYAREAAA